MPSPFPGMDPYVESQAWIDFHTGLLVAMQEQLNALLPASYYVAAEERVYLERWPGGEESLLIRPDLSVLTAPGRSWRPGGAAIAEAGPVALTLPVPEDVEHGYLTVRATETQAVVTIIEVLSRTNKRPGTDGHRDYMEKRAEVLRTRTSLVELNLLRGGERLPTIPAAPPADYYALVSRGNQRPRTDCCHWTVRDPLSAIPIPLDPPDPDVLLDLQGAASLVYDRAAYSRRLNYSAPVEPPLPANDAAWAAERIAAGKGG